MSVQNLVIPVDALGEAVVATIWTSALKTSLGLKICEQALEDSPVNLGSTPEEVEAKLPAVYVYAPGWDEGEGASQSPQASLGNTSLRMRLSYFCQLPIAGRPSDLARKVWQDVSALASLFARPDFRFPGSLSLPPSVQIRRVRPVGIQTFSTDDLADLGVRIGGADCELLIQFATFGIR